MALANKTRFIAAASLALLLAAPVASAKDKMGKEIRVEDVLKGHKSGGSQTARKPAQKSGGDGGEYAKSQSCASRNQAGIVA